MEFSLLSGRNYIRELLASPDFSHDLLSGVFHAELPYMMHKFGRGDRDGDDGGHSCELDAWWTLLLVP
jgi:hypothetical protein